MAASPKPELSDDSPVLCAPETERERRKASLDRFMNNHLDRQSSPDLNQINSKRRDHRRIPTNDRGDFTHPSQFHNSSPNIHTHPVDIMDGEEAPRYGWHLSHRPSARSLDGQYHFQHCKLALYTRPPLLQRHSCIECTDSMRLLVHITPIPKDWRKRRFRSLPVLPSRSLLGLKRSCRRLRSYGSLHKFKEHSMVDWPCFPDGYCVKPDLAMSTLTAYSRPLDGCGEAYKSAEKNSEPSTSDPLWKELYG